ncbi:hypothetical protein L596_012053 [Steinernema carpocapsae]|uniref:G-protein coupled receptors family 1 profile domain-containing protein n=1 Tax=Steinernema carpocapsae TaxID=34508 RepID=A0A4U5NWS6_STECR|nr:hypothetical protein L596_012053 [Steinernema carpocapsae]
MDFSVMTMFFIALDRLLSVTFTLFYERLKTFCYIGFICLVSFTYAISFRVFSYVTFIDAPVLCMIADGTSGSALTSWMICSIAINLGVIGIYVALNFKLSGHAASQQSVTQVTRSLQTLILVYIFGWLFTFVGTTFGMRTIQDPLLFSALMIVLGIQANLNLAAPFFVYFFRSSLYKMEIKKLFERKTVFVASSLSKRSTSFVSTQ